ncbi:MAG: hypothetical protein LQ351_003584 [Letrouitia transgressa]|nr:MAG: hypothetical protein LQ351_003584 [Letrouitia transgressa]
MKFGCRFPRRQVLKWTASYIDYKTLKTLSKAASTEADVSWRDIFDALCGDIEKVERFYVDIVKVILGEKTELYDKYHIAQNGGPGALSLHTQPEDLKALLKSLLKISADLVEIQQFAALNEEVVSRMLSKFGRSRHHRDLNKSGAMICYDRRDQSTFVHQTQASTTLRVVKRTTEWVLSIYARQQHSIHLFAPSSRQSHARLDLVEWDLQPEGGKSPDQVLLGDAEGNTPLHLAVISGTAATTRSLLEIYSHSKVEPDDNRTDDKLQSVLVELLPFAVRSRKQDVVRLLLQYGVDINHRTSSGETALYVASQYGYGEIVSTLLNAESAETTVEIFETSRRWTPLFVACVEGHLPVAKLLLAAGADSLRVDRFGWTAKEHAAYRGHLSLAKLLAAPIIPKSLHLSGSIKTFKSLPFLFGVPRINPGLTLEWGDDAPRYNKETHILVTLGSPNTRDSGGAVALSPRPDIVSHQVSSEAGYTISVQAIAAAVSNELKDPLRLPAVGDMINDPWHFTTRTPEHVKIVFTVFTSDGEGDELVAVGSAVALLQSLRHSVATNREGLARYFRIPILSKGTLGFFGTVTFGLVTVTPRPPREYVPPLARPGFWKEGGPTQVVGHRGSGANSAAHKYLQLGENTIQSYQSAVKLGASAVEFDVQLTKDLIPVIFHDFLVMEAGGDTPLYTLRLNQFQHLSKAQMPKSDLPSMAETRYVEKNAHLNDFRPKLRSKSVGAYDDSRYLDLTDRMKFTESAMAGDHKGNLRGDSIHGMFPTLEDILTNLPETVAFNVEMKYPMLWEAEDRNMDLFAPEINAYVDTVLSTIDRLAGKRSITFSSFSPEVCILLSLKQQDYPVLFLSKAGSVPVGDVRCSSLQQSIRFANTWNLAGIVILSDPLVMCPRLIKYAKSTGLKVCSYGPLNNDPECAKIQADAGLDAIIVDKVKLISTTLSGNHPS